MKFYHDQYNVQWYDKCDTVFRVLYMNTDYLFLCKEDLYMDSHQKTIIQISSVEVNVVVPAPYGILNSILTC